MTTTIVKDTAGLTSALKVAKAGDVIQLQAGTYSPVAITGAKFDGTVTITSQDPATMAKMTGLSVRDSEGLTFRGLEFVVDAGKANNQFHVYGSKNVNLDALNVHGSLDGDPSNDLDGIMIRESTRVSVTNSEFQQLRHGVSHLDSDGVRIDNNHFHDLRTDGVRGGGSSNVSIKGNYFTDFHMAKGDHADAIQFWTTNTTKAVSNIHVEGNLVVRGSGDAIQGILFRDEVGNLPYSGVKIINNMVVGGAFQGISIQAAKDLTLSGNVVAGLADQKSWIGLFNSDRVVMSGNTATAYVTDASTNVVRSGEVTIGTPADGGKALLASWSASVSEKLSVQQVKLNSDSVTLTSLNAGTVSKAALEAQANAAMREMEANRLKTLNITGTANADRLTVDAARDTQIDGGAGNDIIYGGGIGHNTLSGGAGDDTYYVKSVSDRVIESAGGGDDAVVSSVSFSLGANVERLRLLDGAYLGVGNDQDNRISASDAANELRGLGGNDLIQSGGGNDLVSGGEGVDTVMAGSGNDTVQGDAGADRLIGDDGADSISGGLGADWLEGGQGADTLSGGAGADLFQFRPADVGAIDRIIDFSRVEGDKINLAPIDANTSLAGDQRFAFIGSGGFTKTAGELRAVTSNQTTTLMGDTNGDGVADFQIVVVGAGTMQASDFVL